MRYMTASSERCWMVGKVLGLQICTAATVTTASVLREA
jgi:hypothetical protein